jgi:hypothetical protein
MNTRIKSTFIFLALFMLYIKGNAQAENAVDTLRPKHQRLQKLQSEFQYPRKQFFFQGEAVVGFVDFGARFMAGYRFGQFGIVGGGIGIDEILLTLNNNTSDPYNGLYFPIFAHYEGDILRRWVTPYYAVEAGYGFRYTNSSNNNYIEVTPAMPTTDHPVYKYYGGFTGALDFGVKFYATHKVYATLAITLDVQQAGDNYSDYYNNSLGQYIKVSYNSSALILVPGLKVACGF